ncbi:MAG: hypothetical protein ACF8XB_08835 [Planctomycetota bacterium JB042]
MTLPSCRDIERRLRDLERRAERIGGSDDFREAKARWRETGEIPVDGPPLVVEYVRLLAKLEAAVDDLHVLADPSEYDLSDLDTGS